MPADAAAWANAGPGTFASADRSNAIPRKGKPSDERQRDGRSGMAADREF